MFMKSKRFGVWVWYFIVASGGLQMLFIACLDETIFALFFCCFWHHICHNAVLRQLIYRPKVLLERQGTVDQVFFWFIYFYTKKFLDRSAQIRLKHFYVLVCLIFFALPVRKVHFFSLIFLFFELFFGLVDDSSPYISSSTACRTEPAVMARAEFHGQLKVLWSFFFDLFDCSRKLCIIYCDTPHRLHLLKVNQVRFEILAIIPILFFLLAAARLINSDVMTFWTRVKCRFRWARWV